MPQVEANGITLHYEICGHGEPLLLINGLAAQLVDWPEALVAALSEHFLVIRFDNRDCGLSSTIDSAAPTPLDVLKAAARPDKASAPYALRDMAADAVGLLAALGHADAHIAGVSMGAMIAQRIAIEHPTAVRSLCLMMSSPSDRKSGRPTRRVLARMISQAGPRRTTGIEAMLNFYEVVGGADWDRAEHRRRAEIANQRARQRSSATMRHFLAVTTSPDRTVELAAVRARTLVVHGLEDTLVRPSGGVALANAMPSSRLLLFPGMGHDLPSTRHGELVDALVANAQIGPSPAVGPGG